MTEETVEFDGTEFPVLDRAAVDVPEDVEAVAVRRDRETFVAVTTAAAGALDDSPVSVNGEPVTGFVPVESAEGLY